MERFIYKPDVAHNRDQDVPEFGGYSSHELVYPPFREVKPDLYDHEAFQGLKNSAVERVLYFAYGVGNRPPVHFPNGEHFQHIPFSESHWKKYGNIESEASRVGFMLDNYPSRRFPDEYREVCVAALSSNDLLREWANQIPRINGLSVAVFEKALAGMDLSKVHDEFGYSNSDQGAYQSPPVFYRSSEEMLSLELSLWEQANIQIARELSSGNYDNVPVFLHLYSRIKDPISPIRSGLANQSRIFIALHKNTHSAYPAVEPKNEAALVQQLALESSFLALPEARDVAFVLYRGHHELPYIYVDITQFPRGEFANPNRVLEIADEVIADSNRFGVPAITPITVSYCQEPYQASPRLFIIDGNNRATAILVMKYLQHVDYALSQVFEKGRLRSFIVSHDLDIEWERDLVMAIQHMSGERLSHLVANRAIVDAFASSKMPALLVQEPNFHTIAVAQSNGERIVLLQPTHQAIYNQNRCSMAIPSKQQSHGRAAGNDVRVSLR